MAGKVENLIAAIEGFVEVLIARHEYYSHHERMVFTAEEEKAKARLMEALTEWRE